MKPHRRRNKQYFIILHVALKIWSVLSYWFLNHPNFDFYKICIQAGIIRKKWAQTTDGIITRNVSGQGQLCSEAVRFFVHSEAVGFSIVQFSTSFSFLPRMSTLTCVSGVRMIKIIIIQLESKLFKVNTLLTGNYNNICRVLHDKYL